jgi:glycosyltransferase involved in cell wall biosynthesis
MVTARIPNEVVRGADAGVNHYLNSETMHPDIQEDADLTGLTTIAAIGPFDDHAHAQQLASAFITVRRHCEVQLVLIGAGRQRTAVKRRTSAQGVGSSVHVVSDSCDYRWSDLVAAADLVVLGSSSGTATLLDVLAAGRPVVAPAHPATVQLVLPGIVGLVYQPGDASAMAEALLRLVTAPVLRRGMGGRARQVARRHHRERHRANTVHERKPI